MWIFFAPRLFVSPRHPWRGGFIQNMGKEEMKELEKCAYGAVGIYCKLSNESIITAFYYLYSFGACVRQAHQRDTRWHFIYAMRLRRSRQGFSGFLLPLFFWACLRQATSAICAGISRKSLFRKRPFEAFSYINARSFP